MIDSHLLIGQLQHQLFMAFNPDNFKAPCDIVFITPGRAQHKKKLQTTGYLPRCRLTYSSGRSCPVRPTYVAAALVARKISQKRLQRRSCLAARYSRAPRKNERPVDDNSFIDEDIDEDSAVCESEFYNLVVKVFVTTSAPSFLSPWTKKPQSSSTGSAFPIGPQQLLTNAHVVKDATVVRVRRRGDYRKYTARVVRACPLRDLALLSVEDADFWEGLKPVELKEQLPKPQAPVSVVGYPGDSDNVCVTRGVVSRIDMIWYTHDVQLLAVQIDAAINPGNSGGPAMSDDGLCLGVAFEKVTSSDVDNVGYVIPTEVVRHFLDDTNLLGVGYAGFQYQPLEAATARMACGLPEDEQRGVRVRHVDAAADAKDVLHIGDVVLAINSVDVGYDGTVALDDGRPGERVALPYILSRCCVGDTCQLLVWRNERRESVTVKLSSPAQLVPSNPGDPEYLLISSLVFVPLTEPYLYDAYGFEWDREAPPYLVHLYDEGKRKARDEQVLVLAHVLCTGGEEASQEGAVGQTLAKVNGQRAQNLRELDEVVKSNSDRWLRFELENGDIVVVDNQDADQTRERVMDIHQIQKPWRLKGQ